MQNGIPFSRGLMQTPTNVVVMPTCKRLEMTALALEKISESERPPNLEVRIFADTSTNMTELEYVRDKFYPSALLSQADPHPIVPSGMWNILHALKQGYETEADLVYLTEEDIFVAPDYFTWSFHAQNSGDYLAVCGRKHPRLPNYNQYQNPGASFRHRKLGLIAVHITNELFLNRELYYEKHFGKMEEVSTLDDGLVRRIAKHGGYKVLYPDTPKCSHVGFRAYNLYTGWVNEGNIEQRIAGLRRMLPTVDPSNRYTRDFEPFDYAGLCRQAAQARLNTLLRS
jgi:hypothetical protein